MPGGVILSRSQKNKLRLAIEKNKIKKQDLEDFEGMDFFRIDKDFICEQDNKRYCYEEIEKIYNELPNTPENVGMIEWKAIEKNKVVVNRINLLPVDKDEKLIHLLNKL